MFITTTVSMVLLLLAVDPSNANTSMRKCCPLHHRLDKSHHSCELDPSFRDSKENTDKTSLKVSALEAKGFAPGGSPYWMNPNITVWKAADVSEASTHSLLEGFEKGAEVQLGPEPPCPVDRRKLLRWESKNYRLLTNGLLLLRSDNPELPNIELSPEEYCADTTAFGYTLFITCPCDKLLCVKKCCNPREVFNITHHRDGLTTTCFRQEDKELQWKPKFHHSNGSDGIIHDVNYVRVSYSSPVCANDSSLIVLNRGRGSSLKSMKIFRNGSVLLENFGFGIPYSRDDWCGDWSIVDGRRVENVMFCQRLAVPPRNAAAALAYGITFVISAFFLSLTLLVYGLVPDLRRSAYSYSVMCHVASLLVASATVASVQLSDHVDSIAVCRGLGFVIQYSMLASFFWLNLICIDVAWSFRLLLPVRNYSTNERRKFLWYSLYGWGTPLIVTIITVSLEFAKDLPDYIIRPDFGKKYCWMSTVPVFVYFYTPMMIILLMNMSLYCFVAVRLVQAHKATDFVRSSKSMKSSQSEDTKEKWILHAKLFLLMGVTWIIDCVSTAVGHNDAYWYATDIVNMLRGVFIFVIFCCKKDVWRSLQTRFPNWWPRGKSRDRANGSEDSGYSWNTDVTPTRSSQTTQQFVMSLDELRSTRVTLPLDLNDVEKVSDTAEKT